MMTAARRAARSEPANNQLDLLCTAFHNRSNFLFAGSDTSGEGAPVAYSLIGSARLNGSCRGPASGSAMSPLPGS